MRATNRGLFLLLALLVVWAIGGHAFYRIDRWYNTRDYQLLADLAAHKATLADATPSPRIVIAGGSNAYYGIDAHVLEIRLGLPVINLALPFEAHHYRINLALLEQEVRRGDIVVYATSAFWEGPGTMYRARGFNSYLLESKFPRYVRQFDRDNLPWQMFPEMNSLLLAVQDWLSPPTQRSWTSDTDDRGDYTGCVATPSLVPQVYKSEKIDTDLATTLHATAERMKAKGAQLVVHLPWLYILERQRDLWTTFRERVIQKYEPEVPVVAADPAMLLRSDGRDFCDSPLHLSKDATVQRSEVLADALGSYVVHRPTAVGSLPDKVY